LQALKAEGFPGLFGFVTTEGSAKMRETAMDAGAGFLVTKPFTAESFQAELGAILG
jgi:two-component system chemotaxis response regulator CheY